MKSGFRLALLSCLLASGAGLRAADDDTYRFQGMICTGLGDQKELTSSRIGYSFGMHGLYPVQPGEFLRPRVDVTLYPEITWATVQTSGSNLSFGCDFIQNFGGGEPWFGVLGLAEMIWSGSTANRPIPAGPADTTRLGINLGGGYKLNDNVTYEIRYTRSSLSKHFPTASLGLGVTVKF